MRKVVSAVSALALLAIHAMGGSHKGGVQAQERTGPVLAPYVVFRGQPTNLMDAISTEGILRSAKSQRFDSSHEKKSVLGEDSLADLLDLPSSSEIDIPLPVGQSDTIVIGLLDDNGHTFLSSDRTGIYTEYRCQVERVLLSPKNSPLSKVIDVVRGGGAIRLPSGKVLIRGKLNRPLPRGGFRYLFFLGFQEDTRDFLIVGGYVLWEGHAYSLNQLNVPLNDRLAEYVNGDENRLISDTLGIISGKSIVVEHEIPVPKDYSALPEDPELRRRLEARMKRWGNESRFEVSMLKSSEAHPEQYIDQLSGRFPAFPKSFADLVVMVSVSDYQPYFSFDHGTIWTQFEARVKTVYHQSAKVHVGNSDRLLFERLGGAIRFDNRIFTVTLGNHGQPRIEEELILFLKRSDGSSFELVFGYLVRDQHVFPLDATTEYELAGTPLDLFTDKLKQALQK